MKTLYRGATSDEIETIVRFQIEMARETELIRLNPEILLRGVQAVFSEASRGRYYVAFHGYEIAGCALITY